MTNSLDNNPNFVDVTPDGSSTRIFKNVSSVEPVIDKEFLAYEDFITRKPALIESGIEKLVELGLTKDEVMALLGTYSA